MFVDYSGSNPGCSFCWFLNDSMWFKMLSDMVGVLGEEGFEQVEIIDWAGRPPVVFI